MANAESLYDFVGNLAILDHEDQAAGYAGVLELKGFKLLDHSGASPALRAMLEKQYRLHLRSFEKLFEVLYFVQFDDHEFRLPDARERNHG